MSKSKPGELPRVVFVGNGRNKAKYVLKLFHVVTVDVAGVPSTCKLLDDDTRITIEEGMQFMTAYLPAEMFKGS